MELRCEALAGFGAVGARGGGGESSTVSVVDDIIVDSEVAICRSEMAQYRVIILSTTLYSLRLCNSSITLLINLLSVIDIHS